MTVSEKILAALQRRIESGETYYAIGKATGINQQIIARFHRGERKQIRSETIDRLCEYLGLDLQPTAAAKTKAAGGPSSAPAPRTPPPFGDAGEVPKPIKPAAKAKRRPAAGQPAKGKASGRRSSGGRKGR